MVTKLLPLRRAARRLRACVLTYLSVLCPSRSLSQPEIQKPSPHFSFSLQHPDLSTSNQEHGHATKKKRQE